MTALPGNNYEAEANVGRDYFEDVDNFRLAQATLALAHEQRTANLIALMGWLAQQGAVSKPMAVQVDERLGLS